MVASIRALISLIVVVSVVVGSLRAQALTRFEPQTPARASEVNCNFDALKAALASMPMLRPSFRSQSGALTTTVIIPADVRSPIGVRIAGSYYQSTSPLTLDLAATGVGGLDLGTVLPARLYYLYIVLANGSLATLASLTGPGTGPSLTSVGSSWTYVGAFRTNGSSSIVPFVSVRGHYNESASVDDFEVTTSATSPTAYQLVLPAHASSVRGRLLMSGGTASGPGTTREARIGSTPTETLAAIRSEVPNTIYALVDWPLFEPATIYLNLGVDAGLTGVGLVLRTLGWREDPTAFQ
jgi:hypothetical protein